MIVRSLPGGVELRFTERDDGDLAGADPPLDAFAAEGWARVSWLDQQHTDRFVWADGSAPVADALGTGELGHALVVRVADCAPIALAGATIGVAAVHAGWRGLQSGVVARAVRELRTLDSVISAYVGPCIHSECYEFGPDDLAEMVGRFGPGVRASTSGGLPAFDLVAAVVVELERAGVSSITVEDACTACDAHRFFSHRGRGDRARHALAIWRVEQ